MVECHPSKVIVAGPSPVSCFFTLHAGIAQLVERHLAKVDRAGSNPVSRSIFLIKD